MIRVNEVLLSRSSFIFVSAITVNSIVCNFFMILYICLMFLPCINKSDDDNYSDDDDDD